MIRSPESRPSRTRRSAARLWRAGAAALVAAALASCDARGEPVGLVIDPYMEGWSTEMTRRFRATAFYSDGHQEDVAALAAWSSSDEAVATVSAGIVTRVSTGEVVVSATFEGYRDSAVLGVP